MDEKKPTRRKRASIKLEPETTAQPLTLETVASLTKHPAPVTLITGGTGFLGRHLLDVLIANETPNLRVLTTNAPAWLRAMNVDVVEGSILSPEVLERATKNVKAIYHLAGYVSRRPEDAHKMHTLHVEGTRLLCEAAKANHVEAMVLAASSGTLAASTNAHDIADEQSAPPLEIIARWGYYASKYYQERTALESFAGANRRLVIMNPSLLLGAGDERLSSTKIVLDFLARKIHVTPSGGLNFVDVRDAATAFRQAMISGRNGERYLLGAANWTFEKFFARLERISKVAAPRLALPRKLNIFGAKTIDALFKQQSWTSPIEPAEVEQAEHFWYFDSSKAARELNFVPRDPSETLQETVAYIRRNFLGKSAAFAS